MPLRCLHHVALLTLSVLLYSECAADSFGEDSPEAEVLAEAAMAVLDDRDLGAAHSVSQLFDVSGQHLVVSVVTPGNKLTLSVIRLKDLTVTDELTTDKVEGCLLTRASAGNQIGLFFAPAAAEIGTFEALVLELQHGAFSRLSRRWRSPNRSLPVGWQGGDSRFAVLYVVKGQTDCTLESFGTRHSLSTEGHIRADPLNSELLGTAETTGIVILRERNVVTVYRKRPDQSLSVVQEMNATVAATSLDGQSLVVQDDQGVHVYNLRPVRDKQPFVKEATIAPRHEKPLTIKVSRTGRFVALCHQHNCRLFDTCGQPTSQEFKVPGAFDWAISDDGTRLSAAYRAKPSDDNVHVRIIGPKDMDR